MDQNQTFIEKCDLVLKYITGPDAPSPVPSLKISEATGLSLDEVFMIADEMNEMGLVTLSATNMMYNFHVKSEAYRFAAKTTFSKEEERKKSFGSIQNSFNTNTTHGAQSPIASVNSKIEQTVIPEPKAPNNKRWWEPLWEALQKPLNAAVTAGVSAFIAGLLTGQGCNRSDNQLQSPTQLPSTNEKPKGKISLNYKLK